MDDLIFDTEEQSQSQSQSQSQRRKLLARVHASIHSNSGSGSYVWTDEDLQNALLWFRDDHDYDGQLNLVDSLLKSPGIITDRPMVMNINMNTNINQNTNIINTCTRKRQRDEDEVDINMNINTDKATMNRKMKQITMTTRQNSHSCRPLLPFVISQLLSTWVDKDDALQHLKATLRTIASKRIDTREAYHARLDHWSTNELPTLIAGDQEKSLQIYLNHPKTIVKITYAEQLYEQYLHLKKHEDTCTDIHIPVHTGTVESHAPVHASMHVHLGKKPKSIILLEKLCALSNLQSDVAEALLLMTLVPLKRQCCEDKNHDNCGGGGDWTTKITAYLRRGTDHYKTQRSISKGKDNDNDKFEKEALDQLVELIPQQTDFASYDTTRHNQPTSTTCMSTIANLDASLLSSVSKVHFPIAEHIIRSLAKCAVECHDRIHQAPSSLSSDMQEEEEDAGEVGEVLHVQEEGSASTRSSPNSKPWYPNSCYDDCVDSLVQLRNASEVLESLCRQILVTNTSRSNDDTESEGEGEGDKVIVEEKKHASTLAWKTLETNVLSRK